MWNLSPILAVTVFTFISLVSVKYIILFKDYLTVKLGVFYVLHVTCKVELNANSTQTGEVLLQKKFF